MKRLFTIVLLTLGVCLLTVACGVSADPTEETNPLGGRSGAEGSDGRPSSSGDGSGSDNDGGTRSTEGDGPQENNDQDSGSSSSGGDGMPSQSDNGGGPPSQPDSDGGKPSGSGGNGGQPSGTDQCGSALFGEGPLLMGDEAVLKRDGMIGTDGIGRVTLRTCRGLLKVLLVTTANADFELVTQADLGSSIVSGRATQARDGSATVALPRGAYELLVTGAPGTSYEVTLEASTQLPHEMSPEPSADFDEATDLGTLEDDTPRLFGGYTGLLDDADVFRFELAQAATLSLRAGDVSGRIVARLYADARTIGVDDSFAALDTANRTETSTSIRLPRGVYYVRVTRLNANFPHNLYDLTLSIETYDTIEANPEPGRLNTDEFQDLGTLTENTVPEVGGYTGTLDNEDVFRFELAEASTVQLLATGVAGRVTARLYEDDAIIDVSGWFDSTDTANRDAASKTLRLPRGVYFLRVARLNANFPHNHYTLAFDITEYETKEADPEPGNLNNNDVQDLGTLTGDSPPRVGGYTGILDDEDVFRFELAEAAAVELLATSVAGRVVAALYEDDVVIDVAGSFADLDTANRESASKAVRLPRGVYFIRVARLNANFPHNHYTLDIRVTEYVTSEAASDPGGLNSGAHQELGTLTSASPVQVGGYTGILDDEDVFAFELAQPGTVELLATEVAGRVTALVYAEEAVVNVANDLGGLDTANRTSASKSLTLEAGSYFVRVSRLNANFPHNHYTLTLSLQ